MKVGFDDLNRLEQLRDGGGNLLAEYAYDAMRRTSTAAFNSGTGVSETLYSYDDANSRPDHLITLENQKIPGGETISRFDYTYDNEGNRLSKTVEPAWGTETGTISYSYDPIYQLTGAEGPGFPTYPDASFTYDSMGNRTESVFSGQTEVYAANQLNQYTEVSSTNYQYDLNGNLTDDGNQLYEYDWENRLPAVRRKSDNALIAEYRYDPFGRRAKKFVHIPEFRVVNYLYDGAQVIEERNEDFESARRFVYGPGIDEPVSVHNVISGQTYFYQRDGLGSVTELVNAEGKVIDRYRYSPYGKLKIYDGSWNQLTGSTVGNPYFFTGRRYDPESGLYYYRARMYSSEVGRFLQVDPLGYIDGPNLYAYVWNNPINFIDPLGLVSVRPGLKYYRGEDHYQTAIKGTAYELYRASRQSNHEYIATISEDRGRSRVSSPRTSDLPGRVALLRWDWAHDSRRAIVHSHTECGVRGISETDEAVIANIDRAKAALGHEVLLDWYVVDWDGNIWFWDREKGASVFFGSVHNR